MPIVHLDAQFLTIVAVVVAVAFRLDEVHQLTTAAMLYVFQGQREALTAR